MGEEKGVENGKCKAEKGERERENLISLIIM